MVAKGSVQKTPQIRGLATVALLKSELDHGNDFIELFQPFILEAIIDLAGSTISVADLQEALSQRFQLVVPDHSLRVLLGRTAKRGYIKREGGRFTVIPTKLPSPSLAPALETQLKRYEKLGLDLVEFCRQRDLHIASAEEALSLLCEFLSAHHVSLLTDLTPAAARDASEMVSRASTLSRPHQVAVAQFLSDAIATSGDQSSAIQELLEGFVLQNALFLRDISATARKFHNLEVFFDSGIVLGFLGYRGTALQVATTEAFRLLVEAGAALRVFDVTIREMQRIFSVYENLLGTADGRQRLMQTDLTRFFLTNHYTPSMVREATVLLESDLTGKGVKVAIPPGRERDYTTGEKELAERLKAPGSPRGDYEPRVMHDVDCVAGVMTLRRGRVSNTIDDARFVFASASELTIRNVSRWYSETDEVGIPPMVNHVALANTAWLKKPSLGPSTQTYQLAALCKAALQPSPEVWAMFLKHLRGLQETGKLSSDEAVAIVASSLVEKELVEIEYVEEVDANTIDEAIDRVKESYRAEHEVEVRRLRDEGERRLAEERETLGAELERARRERDEKTRVMEEREGAARDEIKKLSTDVHDLRTALTRLAALIGNAISWLVILPVAYFLVLGIRWSWETRNLPRGGWEATVAQVSLFVFMLMSLGSVLFGANTFGLRKRLARLVARWIEGRFSDGNA